MSAGSLDATDLPAGGMPDPFSPPVAAICETLAQLHELIMPVWPLRDYVAVNPYFGMRDQSLLDVRARLQRLSTCEVLMPLAYFQDQFRSGKFGRLEIESAIDEMVADEIPGAESLHANVIIKQLTGVAKTDSEKLAQPIVRSITQRYDDLHGTEWTAHVAEEVSKHCAAHYDQGQASWGSPWKGSSLYEAWREAAQIDRRIELLGLRGFRKFVTKLPHGAEAALEILLRESGVPQSHWVEHLFALSLELPGWSAWTRHVIKQASDHGQKHDDLAGLLAIRLAYDVALSRRERFEVNHVAIHQACTEGSTERLAPDALVRYTLLRASELANRESLLAAMKPSQIDSASSERKLAQMVFCIDVRSERLRRNLETTSRQIETIGFAGFFGMPIEFVRLGEATGTPQLPVLVKPQFQVHEELFAGTDELPQRRTAHTLRRVWKRFQTAAVSCFTAVETTGVLYAGGLISRMIGKTMSAPAVNQHSPSAADFGLLADQGVDWDALAQIAAGMLRGAGLTRDWARLVVLCGHACSTTNNPLRAGLDCGACGGHSGEPNARFAAQLLNNFDVRKRLVAQGIDLPEDVCFVAALHNTTTDEVSFFDTHLLPESHQGDLDELRLHTAVAGRMTRAERIDTLPGATSQSVASRAADWSEVRPEWGLAGNNAMIIGPRSLTMNHNLRGRAFLHSYDQELDPEGAVLEQILTAPLVVANWINMQYYASTVDQVHFGSGCKTIHNVVGKFGVLSGNGGDLRTGLPWQSLHSGQQYQHEPQRLLAVVDASRQVVDDILERHEMVRDLVRNGWIQLVVREEERFHRATAQGTWDTVNAPTFVSPKRSDVPVPVSAENSTRSSARSISHL